MVNIPTNNDVCTMRKQQALSQHLLFEKGKGTDTPLEVILEQKALNLKVSGLLGIHRGAVNP